MEDEQARVITAALRTIRDRVAEILKDSPSCGRAAGEILETLARIEDAAFGQDSTPPLPASDRVGGEQPRRRNQPKIYTRERVGGSEVLAEYRRMSRSQLKV